MPVIALWPLPIGLASSFGQRLQSRRIPHPCRGRRSSGICDGVEACLDEGAGDFLGQRLGALIGPDEVVADGGGHGVLEFGADLGPVLRRIAVVDDLLGVLGDRPEACPQVVVDVGGQVGDAVVEHLLPQRGLLQRVLGLLLAPFQVRGQPSRRVGVVDRGQLGFRDSVEMFGGRTYFRRAPRREPGRSRASAPVR